MMRLVTILFVAILSCSWNVPSLNAQIYTIGVSPCCVKPGGTITASWTVSGGISHANADRIGIYKSDRCETTVGGSCPSGADALSTVTSNSTSGKQSIKAPSATGLYIAYYFPDKGLTIKAISIPFFISSSCGSILLAANPATQVSGQTVVVTWCGASISDTDDWIAFWKIDSSPSTTDHNFIPNAWAYTYGGTTKKNQHPTASGQVSIQVPSLFGRYTVYFCKNAGYTCSSPTTVKVVDPTICKPSPSTTSTVQHIITIIPENHSFDSIYGRYCQATTGSNPTCNIGPFCCEAAPTSVNGSFPKNLTDQENLNFNPSHSASCEICEINNGSMNRYITGCSCSNPSNFAIANSISAIGYYSWAKSYAIGDRYFQSAAGASTENDMYYAVGKFLFLDNTAVPQDKNLNGARCYSSGFKSYYSTTIADLLNYCNISWTFFAEGYDQNPTSHQCYPYYYDAGDDPFTFFPSLITSTQVSSNNFRDLTKLYSDISAGQLPAVSYVKTLGIHTEHPGDSTLTAGQTIAQNIVNAINASDTYRENTVIFVSHDESGGYYDHVSPPPNSIIDNQPYGPRMPFVAIGYQIKQNYISHVPMEPSSLIKFIEWNWLNGSTGQLGTRDTVVNNIGDMFNDTKTGVTIPSN
ncbi:unnamed protein product [Rotaria sordida]|uniref:Acid phosphatase n=1 Tax=Rotaria sordida TaxID=392033 RepID=A0A815CBW2_9BILA|nr:unnamed protein product [Rotaria sordida]